MVRVRAQVPEQAPVLAQRQVPHLAQQRERKQAQLQVPAEASHV